jgi:hypothetical protein
MPYVSREDIIAYIEETVNIVQGSSGTYNILLYRDLIGNDLNASGASNISVAVLNNNGEKVLMYNNPVVPGVSDILNIGSVANGDPGRISFEINGSQSRSLQPGELNIAITIIYTNFFPNSKTYNLPVFKIGQTIELIDTNPGTGTGGGTGGEITNPTLSLGSPQFQIEHIDLDMPSSSGKMSVNASDPTEITEIIFRNLDANLIRISTLENFVTNRIDFEKVQGVITLYDIDNPSFYNIFKIVNWERVDITQGNGTDDIYDGIKLYLSLESISTGPGVSKTNWNIGDSVTYAIDTYGISESQLITQINNHIDQKTDGILTYADKNLQVTITSNGNGSPTGVFITHSPYYDSYVMVEVNGVSVEVG